MRDRLLANPPNELADVCLTYTTRRGRWYDISWKGSPEKSGGLAMNIGIHFFDLLLWLFGGVDRSTVHLNTARKMAGVLELQKARVRWFISAENFLPTLVKRGASIGANATIVCGCTIGEYALIGAGSVVTKDVLPHALVYGNPARRRGWACKCRAVLLFQSLDTTCGDCGRRYYRASESGGRASTRPMSAFRRHDARLLASERRG